MKNVDCSTLGIILFRSQEWHIGINSRYLPLDGMVLAMPLIGLYWLGFALSCRRSLVLVIAFLMLYFPINILSINTPDAARSVQVLPFIYLFIAYGLESIYFVCQGLFSGSKTIWFIVRLLLLSSLILLAILQWNRYWVWIQKVDSLLAREPSIFLSEYPEWLQATQLDIDNTGKSHSIGEWRLAHPFQALLSN